MNKLKMVLKSVWELNISAAVMSLHVRLVWEQLEGG